MDRPSSRQLPLLAAAALGFSSTVFMDDLARLASPTHLTVYHLTGKPTALFVSAIVDTLLLSALCFTALLSARRRPMLHRALWSLLICLYPWIFVRNLNILVMPLSHRDSLTIFALCSAAYLVLTFSGSRSVDHAFPLFEHLGGRVLATVGVAGAVALIEIAFFAVKARHLNDQVVTHAIRRPATAAPNGRVLWIVLDELGYRQLYEHRLDGLQLPAFDQIRAESTVFTNVLPAATRTEIALPALMTGDAVNRVQSTAEGELIIHDPQGWHSFNQRNTVFADADALGYQTSIVGWFNPYCRILPNVLDSCFWVNHSVLDGLSPDQRLVPALAYPLRVLAEKLPTFLSLHEGVTPAEVEEGEGHIRDFVELNHAADAALSDSRNNFLLLHMPIPHPTGIWDRRTGQFAVDLSSYVDNLALADVYLAHVRGLLQASGQWDSTTVIVMGDHSWRTRRIWEALPGWNHDDELASDGGRYDPRPAYLVKLPYQHAAATVQTPFPAVRTRSLLDQLLLGRIANPAQLQQWVAGIQSPDSVATHLSHAASPHRGNHLAHNTGKSDPPTR